MGGKSFNPTSGAFGETLLYCDALHCTPSFCTTLKVTKCNLYITVVTELLYTVLLYNDYETCKHPAWVPGREQ